MCFFLSFFSCMNFINFSSSKENLSFVAGISLFSLSLELFRISILWTYNYCYGYPILMYLEHPLILIQQSILFYFVLKYKNLLDTEVVLLSLSIYLTIFLFMAEILPKQILEYVIVSVWAILIQFFFHRFYL